MRIVVLYDILPYRVLIEPLKLVLSNNTLLVNEKINLNQPHSDRIIILILQTITQVAICKTFILANEKYVVTSVYILVMLIMPKYQHNNSLYLAILSVSLTLELHFTTQFHV